MTGFIILFYLLSFTAAFILMAPRVYFLITAGVLGLMGLCYVVVWPFHHLPFYH